MNLDYAVQIVWSTEDAAYIAMAAELPGCMADGQTPEEALANLRIAINEWIEVAREEKRPIPRPTTIQEIAQGQDEAQRALKQRIKELIEAEVAGAVQKVIATMGPAPTRFIFQGPITPSPESEFQFGPRRPEELEREPN